MKKTCRDLKNLFQKSKFYLPLGSDIQLGNSPSSMAKHPQNRKALSRWMYQLIISSIKLKHNLLVQRSLLALEICFTLEIAHHIHSSSYVTCFSNQMFFAGNSSCLWNLQVYYDFIIKDTFIQRLARTLLPSHLIVHNIPCLVYNDLRQPHVSQELGTGCRAVPGRYVADLASSCHADGH